jgi:hypothetical protein
MANPTNLNAVDLSVNDSTNPNTYFNNYFGSNVKVSPNVDAAILSYFEEVTYNKEAAKALAAAVIYTSSQQGINPMESLKEFTKLPKGELNAYLVMFLNMNRKGTSYLGITNQPIANKYVSRSIIL